MDTYPVMAEAMERTGRKLGFVCSREEVLHLMKDSLSACVREVCARSGQAPEDVMRAFRREEAHLMPFAGPVEGIPAVFRTLHGLGTWHFLVTHRDRSAFRELRRWGLLPLFRDWVTWESGFPRKPDPAGIRHLMERHGLCAGECRMVGDRPLDVQAGERAGMQGILLDREQLFSGMGNWQRAFSGHDLEKLLVRESNGGCQ